MQLGGSRFFDCYIPALGCDVRIHTGGWAIGCCSPCTPGCPAEAMGAAAVVCITAVRPIGQASWLPRHHFLIKPLFLFAGHALKPCVAHPETLPVLQMRCFGVAPPLWMPAGSLRTSESPGLQCVEG